MRGYVGELRALLDSGAVDPERTRAMLAGVEDAPMEEAVTSLRLPMLLLERADALAAAGLGTGARVSRAVVLRRALELGIAELEGEAGSLPATVASEIRAELAELRARVARLEGSRSDAVLAYRPRYRSRFDPEATPPRPEWALELGVDAAARILRELADDGVTVGAVEDAEDAVALAAHYLRAGRLGTAAERLAVALVDVLTEVNESEGLSQARVLALRDALAAARPGAP